MKVPGPSGSLHLLFPALSHCSIYALAISTLIQNQLRYLPFWQRSLQRCAHLELAQLELNQCGFS
jgi:hypothetical protein